MGQSQGGLMAGFVAFRSRATNEAPWGREQKANMKSDSPLLFSVLQRWQNYHNIAPQILGCWLIVDRC